MATYFGDRGRSLALPELQHASDSKHCRRCGHAYVYDAAYLGHLGRYHCPNCGAQRPVPLVVAHATSSCTACARPLRAPHPGRAAEVDLPLPGLYNVYNALGAAGCASPSTSPLDDVVAGLEAVAPAFGRAEASGSAAATSCCCWSRTRPAPTRCCARSCSRRRARPARPAQRPHRRRPRRLLGLGRRLRAARPAPAHDDLRRDPRRRVGRAHEVRRRRPPRCSRVEPDLERALDAALAGGDPAPALRSAHLHGAAGAARPARAPRTRARSTGDERCRDGTTVAGTTSSAGATRGPAAVARAPAQRAAATCSTSAAARAGWRSTSPAAGTRSPAWTPTRRCSRRCASARASCRSPPCTADARAFDLERSFGLVIVPMQTIQLLGGTEGRPRCCGARAGTSPGRPVRRRGGRRARGLRRRGARRAARCPTWASTTAGCSRPSRWPCATRATHVTIERVRADRRARRHAWTPSGDVIELDRLDTGRLAAEGAAAGFAVEPGLSIAATVEHVGSAGGGPACPMSCASARCTPT